MARWVGGIASPERRFLSKLSVGDGCWEWQGAILNRYGVFWVGPEKNHHVKAHRFSYEYFREAIPEGLQLDHLCRNAWCVHPDHLEIVTLVENMRRTRRETCAHGHTFDPANTLTVSTQWGGESRACRACRNRRSRDYKRRTRAAARMTVNA